MNAHDAMQEQDWPVNGSQTVICHALDEAAHCSICRDFFNTPLSLLCGHSFCAECIRANIQFQERKSGKAVCPQCREPADSRQILPNHALRDLVNNYLLARPRLIASYGIAAKDQGVKRHCTRHKLGTEGQASKRLKTTQKGSHSVINLDSQSEPENGDRQLRKRKSNPVYFPDPPSDAEDAALTSESEASQKSSQAPSSGKRKKSDSPAAKGHPQKKAKGSNLPRNWVECPCCQQNFPMAIFNDHLDSCLEGGSKAESPGKAVAKPSKDGVLKNGQRRVGKPRLVVPPKLLMAIEKDRTLKERLRKYNLPIKGTRQALMQELEQRYTRYRVEVQTALDKCESGATYASLANRVISRETSETHANVGSSVTNRPALTKNPSNAPGSDFNDLIRATRLRAAQGGNAKALTPDTDSDAVPRSEEAGPNPPPNQSSKEDLTKASSWGRGFRRASGGESIPVTSATNGTEPYSDMDYRDRQKMNGISFTKSKIPEAQEMEPKPIEHQLMNGCQASHDKSIPWMEEQVDGTIPDDTIEDTEDEEVV